MKYLNSHFITAGKDCVKVADIIARYPEGIHLTAWGSRIRKSGESVIVCTYAEEPENYFYAPNSLYNVLLSTDALYGDHETAVDEFNASGTVVKMRYMDIGEGHYYIVTEGVRAIPKSVLYFLHMLQDGKISHDQIPSENITLDFTMCEQLADVLVTLYHRNIEMSHRIEEYTALNKLTRKVLGGECDEE